MMERKSSNRIANTSTQHVVPIIASTATSSPTSPASDNKADLASLINRVRKKVNDVSPEHSLGPCTIFEIPAHIRRLDRRAYKPAVVPIGPFHHVRWRESAIQEHKWRCVRYLLSRHRKDQSSELLDRCLWALKELDEDVRSCYSKKFSLNAQDMAEIMLLDGCFIIHLLLKHAIKEKEEHAKKEKKEKKRGDVVLEVHHERKEAWEIMGKEKRKEEQASTDGGSGKRVRGTLSGKKEKEDFEALLSKQKMVKLEIEKDHGEIKGPFEAGLFTVKVALYDLLKLENQIPFFIIQILFDLLKNPMDDDVSTPQRVLDLFSNIQPSISNSFETTSIASIHHLLHLFHSSRVFQKRQEKSSDATGCKCIPSATKPKQIGVTCWKKKKKQSDTTGSEWIPSATELRRAGVRFRKMSKKETSFLDISFEKGRMEISPLQVTDQTRSLFRNLIAFEQCYADAMTYVTTYAVFMDCIIDEAKDARLLHLKGIVVNRLSTDKALADLFNKLCNQIHYSSEKNYLADLFVKVNRYYDSRFHRWRAGLMRDYFSSPWTIISVIAAVLLLLLTIEQAVLAGFSYFHPL